MMKVIKDDAGSPHWVGPYMENLVKRCEQALELEDMTMDDLAEGEVVTIKNNDPYTMREIAFSMDFEVICDLKDQWYEKYDPRGYGPAVVYELPNGVYALKQGRYCG